MFEQAEHEPSAGTAYTIELLKFKKVADIISEYSRILCIEPQFLFLLYKGQILDSYATLSSIKLENEIVYLVYTNYSSIPPKKISRSSQILRLFQDICDQIEDASLTELEDRQVDSANEGSDASITTEETGSVGDEDVEVPENTVNDLTEPVPVANTQSVLDEINNIISATQRQIITNNYTEQMEQLRSMGFENSSQNLEALFIFEGNVDLAVNYLVQLQDVSRSNSPSGRRTDSNHSV